MVSTHVLRAKPRPHHALEDMFPARRHERKADMGGQNSMGHFPFFPGILLSRKPPTILWKWLVVEKNDGLKERGINP